MSDIQPNLPDDNPVSDQPAVNFHYPDLAKQALTGVIGHEPTMRLVDLAATTLAAFEGSQDETGDAYMEALEIAARTGMPTVAGMIEGIVAENEPLPRPAAGDVAPDAVLHHTLRLAADQTARRQLLS